MDSRSSALLASRWLEPPSKLPPTAARLSSVRTVGPVIGLVMHAAQVLVFAAMGLGWLAVASPRAYCVVPGERRRQPRAL